MENAALYRTEDVQPFEDPTTGSGLVSLFPEGLGETGKPFVLHVQDPPHKTRDRHCHRGDVIYFYTQGEHHIEGEGIYRAGDVRWTRGGHVYGPETTGPEGASWWVISYQDPIPVATPETARLEAPAAVEPPVLPTFARPYDWEAIHGTVSGAGSVILKEFYDDPYLKRLDAGIDAYLQTHGEMGSPLSGNELYDRFLGLKTVRLHGLIEKFDGAEEMIGNEEIVAFCETAMAEKAASILLNAGELIQIGPGEPAQYLHRDSDSWIDAGIEETPLIVNAIAALDAFTLENGATYIAPGSWTWEAGRTPERHELARAVMDRGDVVLFRGDVLHGGGENTTGACRRAISVSYCAGWLRPVENSFLNISRDRARAASRRVQGLLGYAPHDGTAKKGGLIGLYENRDPALALKRDG